MLWPAELRRHKYVFASCFTRRLMILTAGYSVCQEHLQTFGDNTPHDDHIIIFFM
jgi:hypothetical protein